jgi:ElaB/YqjD/DUF883 family membrane-anchored ribosome-binding protein
VSEDKVPPSVELALTKLQGTVDRGFDRVQGQLELLIQRTDQLDRRADSHAADISAQEARLRELEQSRPRRAELNDLSDRVGELRETAVTQQEMTDYRRQVLGWTGVLVSAIGIFIGAVVSIVLSLTP